MAKLSLVLVVAAVTLSAVLAHCPNSCSGHGNCGRYDKCTCWPNWQGADCSQRTCPYGKSWAYDGTNPHFYTECSSKGICDRSTGVCQCFPEYEGHACIRSSCPNDCSGHGKCRYVSNLPNAATYSGWDAMKIQACVCDGGFYGPDCSQRYCPNGDDPLSVCTSTNKHIQQVVVALGKSDDTTGAVEAGSTQMALSFTDSYGELWQTRPFTLGVAANMETALEGLPNFVISDVSVSLTTGTNVYTYLVTYSGDHVTGLQTGLSCDAVLGCTDAGCQPLYKQWRRVTEDLDAGMDGTDTIVYDPTSVVRTTPVVDTTADVVVTVTIVDTADVETYTFTVDVEGVNVVAAGTAVIVPSGTDAQKTVELWNGVRVIFGDNNADTGNTGVYTLTFSLPKCTISTSQSPDVDYENASCSNRGECDASSGICKCYEGFSGDNCNTQTILM